MTYDEATAFIHSVKWRESRPGLSRIAELSKLIGNPEREFSAVHVAGTNGKGSFCAMLESVLRRAGYKTGLFTSPYLEFFEERIRVNGIPIGKNELAEIVSFVANKCRQMSDPPTEFELLTATGFEYFKNRNTDIAVVECGMGGRLDSTNIIPDPLISVITGVSLDHTRFLGDTVSKIASEKAGIIKSKRPVLFGGNDPEAEKVIAARAEELGCEFRKKDSRKLYDIRCSLTGAVFSYRDYRDVHIPLPGLYQPQNAALVIDAVEILREEGLEISDEVLRDGLASTEWKGRFEVLRRSPLTVFDGGHNAEGVAAAVETARLCFGGRKPVIVSAVLKDKDYRTMAETLSRIAGAVFTVTPENPRALDATEFAAAFREFGINAKPCRNYREAAAAAVALARESDLPVFCVGSLYSYAPFKKALQTAAPVTYSEPAAFSAASSIKI